MSGPTTESVDVAARLAEVCRRIDAAGGDPDVVRVVAVTKGFGAWAVEAALGAGAFDLGENYAQELLAKVAERGGPAVLGGGGPVPRWHMTGRLQRNKVRQIAPHIHLWQSVDRAELGAEIARRAPGASVLVQVNTSGEDQKGGCQPAATRALVTDLRAEGLAVEGLMTVAEAGDEAMARASGRDGARAGFRMLRSLADDLGLPTRSMGMSGDLEAAVAEESTMVRIGTALFGPRSVTNRMRN